MAERNSHFSSNRKNSNGAFHKKSKTSPKRNSASTFKSAQKQGRSGTFQNRPHYNTVIAKKTGAQQGDYVIISNGKEEITTRINLSSHPFAKKDVGTTISIKGERWKLLRILHQGTQEYNRVYDADTERQHYGY